MRGAGRGRSNCHANLPAFIWMHRPPSFAILELPQLQPENVVMCDDSLFFSGPHGKQIKLAQLPPCGLKEWQPHHIAMVVAAVRHGLITIDEACRRYNLSTEVYLCWYRCYALERLTVGLDPIARRKWLRS
jgi:uncharacterized protein DUF1153